MVIITFESTVQFVWGPQVDTNYAMQYLIIVVRDHSAHVLVKVMFDEDILTNDFNCLSVVTCLFPSGQLTLIAGDGIYPLTIAWLAFG
jgi:hypothetical protein